MVLGREPIIAQLQAAQSQSSLKLGIIELELLQHLAHHIFSETFHAGRYQVAIVKLAKIFYASDLSYPEDELVPRKRFRQKHAHPPDGCAIAERQLALLNDCQFV